MLTDDSAAEQRAVKMAFPGLVAGEGEVSHLLCMWHSEQTLKRTMSRPDCKKAQRHLRAALRYRKTTIGCEESIQAAIDAAPEDKRKYVINEWSKTREKWAYTYRTHSPLLLQVPTTSPVEGYHSAIKNKEGKSILQRFSLKGIAQHILAVDKEWDQRAHKALVKFRSCILPQVAPYPYLYKLPTPVQIMLANEIKAANDIMATAGEDPYELDDELRCSCQFYRKYQLPCQHIWHQHILYDIISEEDFERYTFMWEDSGFEIYERVTTEYFERGIDAEIGAPARRRLDIKEALDGIRSRYYALEEQVAAMPKEAADEVVRWWISKLDRITGPLRRGGVEEFKAEIGASEVKNEEGNEAFSTSEVG